MSTTPDPPFQVSYPSGALRRLAELGAAAERADLHPEFMVAIRDLQRRLETDPREWGDPFRTLKGMNCILYRRFGRFFVVYYAVHETERAVFVQDISLSPFSPLEHG